MSDTAMRDSKISRRRASALLLLSPLLPSAFCAGALAQQGSKKAAPDAKSDGPLEIDITQGTLQPIPIAIPRFLGDDARFASEVTAVVMADLERSGLFRALDQASFIDQVRDVNALPRFQDWRVINAQALV